MGERLLGKMHTQKEIAGMSQEQFDAAKTAERERLKILHTEQVRSSRAERLPCETYLLVCRTQLVYIATCVLISSLSQRSDPTPPLSLSHPPCLLLPLFHAAKRWQMTKDGTKGDYMGERLLSKIFTQAQLDGMSQAQFHASKSAENQRLVVLHTQQVVACYCCIP